MLERTPVRLCTTQASFTCFYFHQQQWALRGSSLFTQKIIVKQTHQMRTCAHIPWYLMKFLKAPLKMKLEKICKTFHVAESWPIKSWVFLKGAMKRTSSLLHNINPALKMTKIMNNHTTIFINH